MSELMRCPHCGYTAKIRVCCKRKKRQISIAEDVKALAVVYTYSVRCECGVCHARTRAIKAECELFQPLEKIAPGGYYKYGTYPCVDAAADKAIELWNMRYGGVDSEARRD